MMRHRLRCPGLRLHVQRRVLHFRAPKRTSLHTLRERVTYIITARDAEGREGHGESCRMPGRSPEPETGYAEALEAACRRVEAQEGLSPDDLRDFPSARFGIECALMDLLDLWPKEPARVELHRLIWPGTAGDMLAAMEQGAQQGFRVLKFKLGALPFAEELELVREAARRFPHCTLHGDANGAYSPENLLPRAEALAAAGLHWLEQPLPPGSPDSAILRRALPLPIALDEELTLHSTREARERLLDELKPDMIIIKSMLHGGLAGAEEWAAAAEARGIAWRANSALESHIGLQALLRWCAHRAPGAIQGLGTGQLYTDDLPTPLCFCPPHLFLT